MAEHFFLKGYTKTEAFRSPSMGGGGRSAIPRRNRQSHGEELRRQFSSLIPQFELRRDDADSGDEIRLQVEFEGFPDIELAFESLAREQSGIELLNVREEDGRSFATVSIPDGKLSLFENLLSAYMTERKNKLGRPADHQKLFDTISGVRAATVRSLWTDTTVLFPSDRAAKLWMEMWLPARRKSTDRDGILDVFRNAASEADVRVADGKLLFPERTVVLAYASIAQLEGNVKLLDCIAELRQAKETADFFDSLVPSEQIEWLEELLARTTFETAGSNVPHVCVLDTGVNRGHRLLAPALDSADMHSVEPAWGTNDAKGHGTAMAGLALFGDLTESLENSDSISVQHRLESVKLVQRDTGNGGDPRLFGFATAEAIARPEIAFPIRSRLFQLAITASDNRDRGRPSAWSSAVDLLAADADAEAPRRRLIIVSAGNAADHDAYPAGNSSDSVHDPAQAWNALSVGAFTALTRITEDGSDAYHPVAKDGGLSPFSTTSMTWEKHWPLKPDIVFEGGNLGTDGRKALTFASLSLLTTHHEPTRRSFTTATATSAAAALASRMAARVLAQYPHLKPESVRALLVQSADWTLAMRSMYLPGAPTKADYLRLVRHCGFGVPDERRAIESVKNSLSMVIEDVITPFHRPAGKDVSLREMQLHELPWPKGELEALGEHEVEMRVTLSYFIEPSPSARGPRSRYRYESHCLRFEVKRADESDRAFRARINAAALADDETATTSGGDNGWLLGKTNRHRGALHSDVWRGTAADLASRGVLAVYPAMGWWKTRQKLQRWDSTAPYSLVVSIRTQPVALDLYAAIAKQIAVPTTVAIDGSVTA